MENKTFNIARVSVMDYRESSQADEIRAHALGVQPCHDCRSMDDLHRTHIERLKADLDANRGLAALRGRWKMAAYAGWALALLLMRFGR